MFKCNPQCFAPVLLNGSMTLGELFVPARSLNYGVYRIQLTVAMKLSSQLTASAVTYVNIIPSPVTVNLAQLGSSIITHGQQQTLTLDPGSYSIDPDSTLFNASVCVSLCQQSLAHNFLFFEAWNYTYHCRIDSASPFVNIDEQTNQSCFDNRSSDAPLVLLPFS